MFTLGDIFIGNFQLTQEFGVNPQNYGQFGLKGHNGQDWGCSSNTQVISTADGWVKEVGSDPAGYGNYVKIIHDGFLTLYGHLDHTVVKINDKVLKGQLIGLSDNTGNSTGPHLHFGVAPCNSGGEKTESDNGYAGYIDPNSDRCKWVIENPTAPVPATEQSTQILVNSDDFKKLVHNSDAYDQTCDTLIVPRNADFVEVKKKLDEKDQLYKDAEADAQKYSSQAANLATVLQQVKEDDTNISARNLQLSQTNNTLAGTLSVLATALSAKSVSQQDLLDAITTLKVPQVEAVQQYNALYKFFFIDGLGVYKRSPKAKSIIDKIKSIFGWK